MAKSKFISRAAENYKGSVVLTAEFVGDSQVALKFCDPLTDIIVYRIPHKLISTSELTSIVGTNPAVYALVGVKPGDTKPTVYVGETGGTAKRAVNQCRCSKNQFADWIYVITSFANALNKAHMIVMQRELTNLLRSTSAFESINCTEKTADFSAYDESIARRGFQMSTMLLATSGFPFGPEIFFQAIAKDNVKSAREAASSAIIERRFSTAGDIEVDQVMEFHAPGSKWDHLVATGRLNENGSFTVLPGSDLFGEPEYLDWRTGKTTEAVNFHSLGVATKKIAGRALGKPATRWRPLKDRKSQLDTLRYAVGPYSSEHGDGSTIASLRHGLKLS